MHQNGNHKTRILNKLFNFPTLLFSHLQNVNICSANLHGYCGNKVLEQSLYKPQNAMQTKGIIVPLTFISN